MDSIIEVAKRVDRSLATWCSGCGEPCKSVDDGFSFNNATYYTGCYSSKCCGADLLNDKPENNSD